MAQTTIKQRQIAGGLDGWIPAEETWTYASATTFTISGDKTSKYQKGDKIKLTQTTVKYFYIIGISYSAPNTTVTVTGGTDYTVANAAITLPYFSKIENPQGFPHTFAYTPSITYGGGTTNPTTATASGTFRLIGNICHVIFYYNVSTRGTGDRNVVILTLPITAANSYSIAGSSWNVIYPGAIISNYPVYNATTTTCSHYLGGAMTQASGAMQSNVFYEIA